MSVQSLVSQNRIKDALSLFPDNNETLLLKSRFSNLEREERLGLLSYEQASLKRNQIVSAILSLSGDVVAQSYQATSHYQASTPNRLTPSQIRAILERKNIGEAETNELIAACSQVLDFFKSNLSDDEYLDLCADAEMAFRKFSARTKDEDRKFSLIEQVQKMLPDYENFAEVSNTEGVLETLYNNASEQASIATISTYLTAVIRKFPALANLSNEWEVDQIEFTDKVMGATAISRRMHEKQLCGRWLAKIGRK